LHLSKICSVVFVEGAAFDSAESFDPELTTDELTIEGLVAGQPQEIFTR
jgi:hypothetical protein